MSDTGEPAPFRLGYVPGATPDKWARMWAQRRPGVPLELVGGTTDELLDAIRAGALDAGVVRMPFDRAGLHAIPLYTEVTVAVAPKDHVLAAVDSAGVDDLADDVVLRLRDDTLAWSDDRPGRPPGCGPTTTPEAVELVAAGVGLLVLPLSLARLHHRRDLLHRPLTDAPESSVVLTWPDAENSDGMEELIGIVRGRTAHSSRTRRRQDAPAPPAPSPPGRKRPPSRGRRAGSRRPGR